MNNTLIRKIDDLGRVLLPIDVRKKLNINAGDSLSFEIYNDSLIIKKLTNLQSIIWLAEIIIKDLFEIYKLDCALESDNTILVTTNKKNNNGEKFPIIFNNKLIGNFIVYNYQDKYANIINFIVLIFKKCLEEQE